MKGVSDGLHPATRLDHFDSPHYHLYLTLLSSNFPQSVDKTYYTVDWSLDDNVGRRCCNGRGIPMQANFVLLEPRNRRGQVHPCGSLLLLRRYHEHCSYYLRAFPPSTDNPQTKGNDSEKSRSGKLFHPGRLRWNS